MTFTSRALLTLALVTLAGRAEAQVTGLPVHNGGVTGGLTFGAEVGFPDEDYGEGTAYGARAALGTGPFGVGALVSRWNPEGVGEAATAVAGYLNFKVFGGPLIPLSVTLQGGAEYAERNGVKVLHTPVGLGIALKIPNPALAIKPWLAPRLDIVHVTTSGTDRETNFGLSGGVDLSLLGGIGFSVAYDRTFAGDGVNPSVLSVGANYAIRVPGL